MKPLHAWFILKNDYECSGELDLAHAEFDAILSRLNGRKITFAQSDIPPTLQSVEGVACVEVDLEAFLQLISRLAYWDAAVLKKGEYQSNKAYPGDFRLAGDHVIVFTSSSTLERGATGKNYGEDQYSLDEFIQRNFRKREKIEKGSLNRKKNTYSTHDIHKYKAKFFPRLSRVLANIVGPDSNSTLLDPFCGSGTLNLEASLMGLGSIGFDIDPLSVKIANTKCMLAGLSEAYQDRIEKLANELFSPAVGSSSEKTFKLPSFLIRERSKSLTPEVARCIEKDVSLARQRVDSISDPIEKQISELLLSDALASKISLRWMGTGDDRFAIEVARRSMDSIARAHARQLVARLRVHNASRSRLPNPMGVAQISGANVTSLPLEAASVDGIVTSPPYLPASSGRETYLRSRAASITALNLLDTDQILTLETSMMGSIKAAEAGGIFLPEEVQSLVNWMLPQRARSNKARPTAAYFEQLALALQETARVLKPGGKAAFVVSRYHTFYELVSKAVVWQFDMPKNIIEMVADPRNGIALNVDKVYHIELGKADFAARPASSGAYFEAVIVFEAPYRN